MRVVSSCASYLGSIVYVYLFQVLGIRDFSKSLELVESWSRAVFGEPVVAVVVALLREARHRRSSVQFSHFKGLELL